MGEHSAIQWTDNTWNPWMGCKKVSPGCKFCYSYRQQTAWGMDPTEIRRSKTKFYEPLKWRKPVKVFTCSWSDFFIEQADAWRDEAWEVIRKTPHLTYQILTKRPQNIKDRLPDNWGSGWPNVWLGVSVENEDYLWRVDALRTVFAVVRFISYEPALGQVDFTPYIRVIQWIISGGESKSPRSANLEWFRGVRDLCIQYGVAYFHKQNGGNRKIDEAYGGRKLDGKIWHQFPKIQKGK